MGHSQNLSISIFVFSTVNRNQVLHIKFGQWLNSNCRPLVFEATALPTEPKPLPMVNYFSILKVEVQSHILNDKAHLA